MKTTVKLLTDPRTEAEHQRNVFAWAMIHRAEYPELKLLHHVKNEEEGGVKQVAIDKANGVKKGFPDLILPVKRGGYGGLFIEMKSLSGSPTPEQKWWIDELKAQGQFACVCRGWEKAVQVIEWYMGVEAQGDGGD